MRISTGTIDKVQINMSNVNEEIYYVALLQRVHKAWTNAASLTATAFIFCFYFFPWGNLIKDHTQRIFLLSVVQKD